MILQIKKQTEGMTAKRNIKDCFFTNMFGDKKYLIQRQSRDIGKENRYSRMINQAKQ